MGYTGAPRLLPSFTYRSRSEKKGGLALQALLDTLALCLILVTIAPVQADSETEDERLLKAAFVFNFAKFSSWPESDKGETDNPLTLCTMGENELIPELSRLDGRPIKGRHLAVEPLQDREGVEVCHLLYISGSKSSVYRRTLEALRDKPVLTVSQIPGFARAGGMIEIFPRGEMISFSINIAAARRGGVEISSRLLGLAEVVVGMEESP